MNDRTPAECLNAAAYLIETAAAKATPGPWRATEQEAVVTARGARTVLDDWSGEGNAAWIALVGPDLAPDLAAMLRYEAGQWESVGTDPSVAALAFAGRILGDDRRGKS